MTEYVKYHIEIKTSQMCILKANRTVWIRSGDFGRAALVWPAAVPPEYRRLDAVWCCDMVRESVGLIVRRERERGGEAQQ